MFVAIPGLMLVAIGSHARGTIRDGDIKEGNQSGADEPEGDEGHAESSARFHSNSDEKHQRDITPCARVAVMTRAIISESSLLLETTARRVLENSGPDVPWCGQSGSGSNGHGGRHLMCVLHAPGWRRALLRFSLANAPRCS